MDTSQIHRAVLEEGGKKSLESVLNFITVTGAMTPKTSNEIYDS